MPKRISVKLDDYAMRALVALEAQGLDRSETIASALKAYARRYRDSRALRAEVEALERDVHDRSEMRAIADFMARLRPH